MKEIFRGLKYIKENKFIKYTVVGISNTGISIMFNYVFLFCGIFPGFSYALSYIIPIIISGFITYFQYLNAVVKPIKGGE